MQSVEIEELAEERAGGEAESTLEVSEENNPLASTRVRHDLGAGDTPLDFGWHLPGANQRLDGAGGDRRALPAPAARLRGISPWRHGICGRRREGERGAREQRWEVTAEAKERAGSRPEQVPCAEAKLQARQRASSGAAMAQESKRWRRKTTFERRKRRRPSPVAYMGGGGGEWDTVAAVWPGVA